jgi:peptidoglycan/xylan/chitin deacetylase (PgdA/CDA1 family)
MSERARRSIRNERKYRRRRRTAAAAALGVVALVVVVVVVSLGGSGSPRAAASGTRAPAAAAKSRHHVVRDGPHGTESVPILMYHVILAPPADAPYPGLYVTPGLFAEQMHALAAAGYHAVTMNQMWDNWHYGTPLPRGKPIVLSFDNGYESQYRFALPVLRAMGWVGVENLQLSGLPVSQGGISRQQVRGLVAAGWELDTQGWNHADLDIQSPSQLYFQVSVARKRIRALYHVHADWFCYPSGDYDAAVIAAVKAAGFRGSTTVIPGWASPGGDPYKLPRLRVLGGWSAATLLSEIAGIRGYAPPGASYTA